jgi:Cutinase
MVLRECPNPRIFLVGYSLGSWVIDEWLSREKEQGGGKDLWDYIKAVELYGDPLWYRRGSAYLGGPVDTYGGLARRRLTPVKPNPYENNTQGPGGDLSNRWQSRCLRGDQVCGEGYASDFVSGIVQIKDAIVCIATFCEHKKYALSPDPSKADQVGYGLTERGGKFLALKTFPEVFTTTGPHIAHYETFTEGDLVHIRLYHTGYPTGFGFVGVNGSGWAREEIPFFVPTTPYWTRVSPGRVDYPFKHVCSTAPGNQSDIEAWVYRDGFTPRESTHVKIHMACSAPKEMITPFFDH